MARRVAHMVYTGHAPLYTTQASPIWQCPGDARKLQILMHRWFHSFITAVVSLYRALYRGRVNVRLRVHGTAGGLDGLQLIGSSLRGPLCLWGVENRLEPLETAMKRWGLRRACQCETGPLHCIKACVENRSIERGTTVYRIYLVQRSLSFSQLACVIYSVTAIYTAKHDTAYTVYM